jgi:hypothetical protein
MFFGVSVGTKFVRYLRRRDIGGGDAGAGGAQAPGLFQVMGHPC